ncbi:LOW QUALITY PROTEIN: vertnin [Urocitellus parryii]
MEYESLECVISATLEAKQVLLSFTPTSQKESPELQVLEVDLVSLNLYLEDVPQNMQLLACQGKGSFLFKTVSMLLWGEVGLNLKLYICTVVEMLLHHYYLQSMIDSKVILQIVYYNLSSQKFPQMTSLPPAMLETIFYVDISRSTYYEWKGKLLVSGACSAPATALSESLAIEALEKLPAERTAEGLRLSLLIVKSKLYLEHCIFLNTLVSDRCFKHRFPGISRSTYNWWQKNYWRNPSFRTAPALTNGTPQLVSVGEGPLLHWKHKIGEGARKGTSGTPFPAGQLLPLRCPFVKQRYLHRAMTKQVLHGQLSFSHPSLIPHTFCIWKSLSWSWPRDLSKLQIQTPSLGSEGQRLRRKRKNLTGI